MEGLAFPLPGPGVEVVQLNWVWKFWQLQCSGGWQLQAVNLCSKGVATNNVNAAHSAPFLKGPSLCKVLALYQVCKSCLRADWGAGSSIDDGLIYPS